MIFYIYDPGHASVDIIGHVDNSDSASGDIMDRIDKVLGDLGTAMFLLAFIFGFILTVIVLSEVQCDKKLIPMGGDTCCEVLQDKTR